MNKTFNNIKCFFRKFNYTKQLIIRYLKSFLLSQLAITLILLPVLSSWGIEISWMSLIGNLIFLPFLISFLFTSSLLFLTELIGIPNQIFIKIIELITTTWNKLLGIQSKSWLVSFPSHSTIFLLSMAIATLIFYKSRRVKTFNQKITVLSSSVAIMILILKLLSPETATSYSFENKLFINKKSKTFSEETFNVNVDEIYITDDGFFNRKTNPGKCVEFELKPFLISKFGSTKIKELKLKRFTIRSFRATMACCKLMNVQKVTLPYFKKKFTKKTFAIFFAMKRMLDKNNVDFKRTQLS